jgi:transposase-like protein
MESYHHANEAQAAPDPEQGLQTTQPGDPEGAGKGRALAQRIVSRAGLAREMSSGLLATVCELGLRAVAELFEEEVTERVGPKGKHNPHRPGVRHGYDTGEVTLGGRRLQIRRPRMRSREGVELPLEVYRWAAEREILDRIALQRVMVGVSMRNYPLALEPVSARDAHRPRSTSKSSISRRFIRLTAHALDQMLARDLRDLRPVALMIDGIHIAGRMLVVAMVIDMDGYKHPIALREGATENARVVTDLLADLVDRGLDSSHGLLVVIDGSKALAAAVRRTFGDMALIQRCIEHKIRNVVDYLQKEEQPWVTRSLRKILRRTDAELARRELDALARRLEETNIDAAKSLREGLDELLTVHRLGIGQTLARTLRTTNALESLNEIIRAKTRQVKRWRDGDMRERWVAAAMLEAESQFRRVQGYTELPALARAIYHATVLKQAPSQRTGGHATDTAA